VYVFVQDSSVSTGAGKTDLAFNSAGLSAYYVRPLAAAVAITLATQTVTGAYSSGGFTAVDAANMPGVYRLDLPDAVCASGVNAAVVMLKGAANMAPVTLEIQLTNFDLNDADPDVNVVKWLGTACATPTVAGVPEVDITHFNGVAGTFASGRPEVNTTHIAGNAVNTGSAQLGVNVVQISGDAIAADNAEAFFDGTGYGGANNVIPTVTTTTNVAVVNGLANNVITAASIADGAIDAATFAAGAINAAAIAPDAIGASELAADALAEIADQVWDEVLAGHLTAGTTGAALNGAGSAGDPWGTALPGAYGAGSAGKIVGDFLNATVSSRASQASLDALPTANENAGALLDTANDIETGISVRNALRATLAMLAGQVTGAGTGSEIFKNPAATKNRVTVTVDTNGNRSAITFDFS
jgi:hypothetical protein